MLIREYQPKDRDALLALRADQEEKWFGSQGNLSGFDASDPSLAVLYVLEDDLGRIVAAMGAKITAEIRMVRDMDWRGNDPAAVIREELIPMWARVVASLHKMGIPDCVAFIHPKLKQWGNSLVRRAGFKRVSDAVFSFNVREAAKAVTDGSS